MDQDATWYRAMPQPSGLCVIYLPGLKARPSPGWFSIRVGFYARGPGRARPAFRLGPVERVKHVRQI